MAGVVLSACLVFGHIGFSDSSGLALAKTQHETEAEWVRSFPLWMGIPRKSFAKLGEGVVHKRRWGVYVYRDDGPGAGRRPCVEIGALYFGGGRGGAFQHRSACGALAPPAEQPLLNESGFRIKPGFDGPFVSDTVIALAVPKTVIEVKVQLHGGRTILKRTRLLTSEQASKANIIQFRYVTLAVGRRDCVMSTIGYDDTGSVLFRSPSRSCR